MTLANDVQMAILSFLDNGGISAENLIVNVEDPWNFEASFYELGGDRTTIRSLREGDSESLISFGDALSGRSKHLFCPYPWRNPVGLDSAVRSAVHGVTRRVDASYLILDGRTPIAHFFLWKNGGNEHSAEYGVEVPELGVGVVDRRHGLGLGGLAVNLLKAVAHASERDAIELTTAMENGGGWHVYQRAGFEYVGDILNPLEVDVTEAIKGNSVVEESRRERQMVYVVNPKSRNDTLAYLETKRKKSERLFG
jgi:hypothetical protein